MKIIHVIPTLANAGAEVLVGNIALEQVRVGNDVIIVVFEEMHPTFSNYFLKEKLEKEILIIQIKARVSFSFFKNKIEIKSDDFEKIVNDFSPDVIHSHLYQAELVSRSIIQDNIKYISHCHNNMSQFNFFAEKLNKRRITDYLELNWLKKRYFLSDTIFIAISKNTEQYFKSKLPTRLAKNVFLLGNAINTSHYFSKVHDDLNLVKLISVGNLLPNKGHLFLVDVVSVLKRKGYRISLDILGFGPMENEILEKIKKMNLESEIFLKGSVSNVNEFLSQSNIYVHSAYSEAFGLVLLEAMASGLPVITTDGGGNRDLIKDGFNGYLIKNRDIDLYVEKLELLINNPQKIKEIRNYSVEFVKQFDIKYYVEKLSKLYQNAFTR